MYGSEGHFLYLEPSEQAAHHHFVRFQTAFSVFGTVGTGSRPPFCTVPNGIFCIWNRRNRQQTNFCTVQKGISCIWNRQNGLFVRFKMKFPASKPSQKLLQTRGRSSRRRFPLQKPGGASRPLIRLLHPEAGEKAGGKVREKARKKVPKDRRQSRENGCQVIDICQKQSYTERKRTGGGQKEEAAGQKG